MATDEKIIEILEDAIQYAETHFAVSRPSSRDPDFPVPFPTAVFELLADALAKHPDFGTEEIRYFMASFLQFGPYEQADNILTLATMAGAQETLDWYRRTQAIKTARIRVVGQVYGLEVASPVTFSNGMSLMPASALTNSPTSRVFVKFGGRPKFETPPTLIVKEFENVPSHADFKNGLEEYSRVCDDMRRFLNAFSLTGELAPTIQETWSEFTDADLQAFQLTNGWHRNPVDGTPPMRTFELTEDAIESVEGYLALDAKVREKLDVPLSRLSMAKRRISPGDQALDGCICLESLLSGTGQGELTHRLSVRAALLLETSFEKRDLMMRTVKSFYDLRSRTVHGGKVAKKEDSTIARRGLEVCRLVLNEIVDAKQDFNSDDWELTGGPPWKRYNGE